MGDTARADETFDQAIKLLREAFNQRAAAKDAEIARLRNEISRRDGKIEELQKRVSRLIDDLQRATQQNTSLSTEVARLYAFRQSILESFDDRDLSDLRTAGKGHAVRRAGHIGRAAAAAAAAGAAAASDDALFDSDAFLADGYTGRAAPTSRADPPAPTTAAAAAAASALDAGLGDLSLNDSLFDLKGPAAPTAAPSAAPRRTEAAAPARTSAGADRAPATAPAPSSGAPQAIDGSAFFALAQTRLSYDKGRAHSGRDGADRGGRAAGGAYATPQFNALLAQIQRYNRRERTKDEVIDAVAALLENKHRDVLDALIALLNPGQSAAS